MFSRNRFSKFNHIKESLSHKFLHKKSMKYIIYSFLNTYYLVDKEQLTLVVKPFYKKKIALNTIKRIEKSSSLLSAPAPSFKRLEIFYGSFNSELVSPNDQKAFIELLKKYNPEIIVKL